MGQREGSKVRRNIGAAVLVILVGAASVVAVASAGGRSGHVSAKPPARFEQHDLYIEYNATDGDAGLQLAGDAEEWKRFTLFDRKGKVIADVKAKGAMRRFGLSELFFEASEPPFTEFSFRQFKRQFPAGRYRFRAVTPDGRAFVGSDRLTHVIPAAPRVTYPTEGVQVDREAFKVTWEPVTRPAGIKIVSYQLIVNQGSRELSMYLPPTATGATVPPEFLKANTATDGELLAREKSGNQTITALPAFRTK
jgi:hypothetical protein